MLMFMDSRHVGWMEWDGGVEARIGKGKALLVYGLFGWRFEMV